jgi:hypothetical protein
MYVCMHACKQLVLGRTAHLHGMYACMHAGIYYHSIKQHLEGILAGGDFPHDDSESINIGEVRIELPREEFEENKWCKHSGTRSSPR